MLRYASYSRVVLALFVGLLTVVSADEDSKSEQQIQGEWLVENVELGGNSIDGLAAARLVLGADGQKTFTLPSGVVE